MILVVGASVRALMESAAESGQDVTGLDFFGDVDAGWQGKAMSLTGDYGLKPTVGNLLEAARGISCETLVYTSGPENTPEGLAYWEDLGQLGGNSIAALTKVRNPWELRASLGKIGARMPPFFAVKEWTPPSPPKTWLLKPLDRGGGHGIEVLPPNKEAAEAVLSGLKQPARYRIEEYQAGIPGSVTFLANGHEAVVLGSSRQLAGTRARNRTFLYQGNIVPLDLSGMMTSKTFAEEITQVIRQLTEDFALRGINTLDFIINGGGICFLELNPRWSASVELIEKSLDQRFFSWHLAASAGADLTVLRKYLELITIKLGRFARSRIFWGKRIVYTQAPGMVVKYDNRVLRSLYRQGVRDIPREGTRLEKGQPICTVLAEGSSDRECDRQLWAKAIWIRQYFEQAEGYALI